MNGEEIVRVDPKEGVKCSDKVWDSFSLRSRPCQRRAKVVENGVAYCGIHDPERIRSRRAKWGQEAQRSRDLMNSAQELASRLGGGAPHYDHQSSTYTGGVVLSRVQALRLIARLDGYTDEQISQMEGMWE